MLNIPEGPKHKTSKKAKEEKNFILLASLGASVLVVPVFLLHDMLTTTNDNCRDFIFNKKRKRTDF